MLSKKIGISVLIIVIISLSGAIITIILKEPFPSPTLKEEPDEVEEIPDSIIEKSNEFVISRVGVDFFDNYISLDEEKSRYQQEDTFCIENPESCSEYLQSPHYLIFYLLNIPEKPFVNETIEIALFETGEVIKERDISIPNCQEEPIKCEFPINREEALSIAQSEGLKEGVKDWDTSFHWYAGDIKNYVWTVSSTLIDGRGYRSGEVIVINANTGDIIKVSEWDQYVY